MNEVIAARDLIGPPQKILPLRPSLISRFSDFWLLGGVSILLWALMLAGQAFRGSSEAVESHFIQLSAVFSMLSIFCNHPHFLISYRFGYGRGYRFVLRNWVALLAVPVGLVALYAVAYLNFEADVSNSWLVRNVNPWIAKTGLTFRLGTLDNLGTEVLSLSVWLMFLTVGWHYSKQAFGCMMVYAKYDGYPLTRRQRTLVKLSLFSVAFFNFFYFSIYAPDYSSNPLSQNYFFNIPLVSLGLPKILIPLSTVAVILSAFAVLIGVIGKNLGALKKRPTAGFLVPWVALHVWWVPLFRQNEFYFLMIPFFHSLQYLPFAYRMERPKFSKNAWYGFNISIKLAALLFAGFCAFELVPSLLDRGLDTPGHLKTWFFMIAFAVFINVHHFFIDSVVWKFDQADIRESLLAS